MIQKRYNKFIATRTEYWAVLLAVMAMSAWSTAAATSNGPSQDLAAVASFAAFGSLWLVTIARCRDAGLNGWWCLAIFIPLGSLYFGCIRNDDHPKKLSVFAPISRRVSASFDPLRIHNQE